MKPTTDRVLDPAAPPPAPAAPPGEARCGRCKKLLEPPEREIYFARTGLCFWCAYVDSQG